MIYFDSLIKQYPKGEVGTIDCIYHSKGEVGTNGCNYLFHEI
jgi:hypothetical protein